MSAAKDQAAVDESKDLPLMSNADEIRIRHYMFRLKCCSDLKEKTFEGQVIIFLTPLQQQQQRNNTVRYNKPFDICNLQVKRFHKPEKECGLFSDFLIVCYFFLLSFYSKIFQF